MSSEGQPQLEVGPLLYALEAFTDSVEIDSLDGSINFVNNAWCRLFDRDREEVLSTRWDSLQLGYATDTELTDTWDKCLEVGESHGELNIRRSGTSEPRVSFTRTLYRDFDGAATAIITIYRTINEVVTSSEDYSRFVALLENRRNGMVVLDTDQNIIAANQTFGELIGYRNNEMTGLNIESVLPGITKVSMQSWEESDWWAGTMDMIGKDGSSSPMWLSVSRLRDSGRSAVGFLVRIRDTEDREMTIDDMAQFAHQMRNVFTAIAIPVELIMKTPPEDPKLRDRLTVIQRALEMGLDALK